MAANAAVSALLKPTAQVGRNNFPLDNKHVYSMKAGQIQPVKAFHYEPNTHLDIQAHDFTMTFPMQTAPFLRGRKEFSFYSVYYNAVWSLYNQYQGTRNDPKTSAFGQTPSLQEPRMNLYHIFGAVYAQWVCYMYYENIIPYLIKDYIAQNSLTDDVDQMTNLAQLSFLSTLYQGVDAYRTLSINFTNPNDNSQWTFLFSLDAQVYSAFEINFYDLKDSQHNYYDFAHYCQDVVGHFRAYNWMRKLDMLGYGNLYTVFHDAEEAFIDYISYSPSYTDAWSQFKQLCASLESDIMKMTCTYDPNVSPWTPSSWRLVNLYPICAYNSVFYHFFRNSYYDTDYYTHDYNLDFVSVDTLHGSFNIVTPSDFSLRFFDIEYHQWKKDTFTGVLPTTQFGAVSSVDVSPNSSNIMSGSDYGNWIVRDGSSWEGNYNVSTSNTSNSLKNNNNAKIIQHVHGVPTVHSTFDVIALKRAEMLQEYRQQLMRAGNRTSDVFKAIYGGSPSSEHEDDVIPRFLDTFGMDLFVDPVTATADTQQGDNGKLGDIAARGKFRGDSGHIKFNAGGNFGLILCFCYVVPVAEYNSYMYDKHIFELTPEDHFIPQFENLGLEPIYSFELNMLQNANDIKVLGYGPRYHHKKSELDLVHGAFCSRVFNRRSNAYSWYGSFNNWVSPRSDLQCRNTTSIRDFYINPSVLDNVFVRQAGADQADDQFICNTYFEVNAIKGMSKIGLLNFV